MIRAALCAAMAASVMAGAFQPPSTQTSFVGNTHLSSTSIPIAASSASEAHYPSSSASAALESSISFLPQESEKPVAKNVPASRRKYYFKYGLGNVIPRNVQLLIDPDEPVSHLKLQLEKETGVATFEQQFYFNGETLNLQDNQSLRQNGLHGGGYFTLERVEGLPLESRQTVALDTTPTKESEDKLETNDVEILLAAERGPGQIIHVAEGTPKEFKRGDRHAEARSSLGVNFPLGAHAKSQEVLYDYDDDQDAVKSQAEEEPILLEELNTPAPPRWGETDDDDGIPGSSFVVPPQAILEDVKEIIKKSADDKSKLRSILTDMDEEDDESSLEEPAMQVEADKEVIEDLVVSKAETVVSPMPLEESKPADVAKNPLDQLADVGHDLSETLSTTKVGKHESSVTYEEALDKVGKGAQGVFALASAFGGFVKDTVEQDLEAREAAQMEADEKRLPPKVQFVNGVMGDGALTKVGAVSGGTLLPSAVIGSFVDTPNSAFGDAVLRSLFKLADMNGNGMICEQELRVALQSLGLLWSSQGISISGLIEMDAWVSGAPNTLRTNLMKLAKSTIPVTQKKETTPMT